MYRLETNGNKLSLLTDRYLTDYIRSNGGVLKSVNILFNTSVTGTSEQNATTKESIKARFSHNRHNGELEMIILGERHRLPNPHKVSHFELIDSINTIYKQNDSLTRVTGVQVF